MSKIVKSAHRRAGRPGPLKEFARDQVARGTELAPACAAWLKAKNCLTLKELAERGEN